MPPLRCSSIIPSTACAKQVCRTGQTSRCFSTTPANEQRVTRARRALYSWLNLQGANFKNPLPGSTNYLSAYNNAGQLTRVLQKQREDKEEADKKAKEGSATNQPSTASQQNTKPGKEAVETDAEGNPKLPPEKLRDLAPYPLNPEFISQSVLTAEFREHIWQLVMEEGKSVREVSAETKVEMSRVAAVVRLIEIEKEWKRINKPLAEKYHEAVQSMLPKTELELDKPQNRRTAHESINDLPVHAATGQQIWLPTSESRHFTRADAAKVFDENLLPADQRVPHPELAVLHKEVLDGLPWEERQRLAEQREAVAEQKMEAKIARQLKKEASVKKVDKGRFLFRISEIKVDDVGKDGRGLKGTGWRYGVPLMDRSRGQHKIPSSVG